MRLPGNCGRDKETLGLTTLCPCVNTMSKTKFSDEERLCFYNAILHLDSEKQFVTVDKDNDTLTYNRKNLKSGEKISGRPSGPWSKYDPKDKNTVLGQLRALRLWQ